MIFVGTCGFPVSRERVFSSMDAVELQETFYDMPNSERMSRLKGEAHPDFKFSVKVFQGITHGPGSPTMKRSKQFTPAENTGNLKPTHQNLELWNSFRKETLALAPSLYIFQTPPSFGSEEQLRDAYEFFKNIQHEAKVGWEPRGKAYNNAEMTIKIFDDLGVVHVYDPFRRSPIKVSGLQYLRLHGKGNGETNYSYIYTDGDLYELHLKVQKYSEAFVMFNNMNMFEDAKAFRSKFL
ncbi:MAG: DUF72 domain-containing protein [Nitrososphaerota archaeon]|jgi:uncharacterized protein YecE (DUF72 family)|nr:DUF72 domain-containing protein [Nitrososphaerota archaeon]MDG6931396.1 DUF72 domain-containing protein [Nitrososphaerota archaeon]MDG6936806.1 DUF72 domain-containing protein [Nitrososphaerota archaeon]MDG6943662.1 DUF72 domain-containing protein [Nitrososphaerota archaeon]